MPTFTFMLHEREFGCYAEFSCPSPAEKLRLDDIFFAGFAIPLDDAARNDLSEAANAVDCQCFGLLGSLAEPEGNTSLLIARGFATYKAKADQHRLAQGDVTITFTIDHESEDKTHVLAKRLVDVTSNIILARFPKPEPEEG